MEAVMLHNVSLNASMRANLLSLQQTSKLQDMTSNRLSTGLKVNSAIDNPSAYYTARSLSDRASDLNALLDAMSQGIQTLKTVSKTLETASAFLGQAAAVLTQSYTQTETAAVHKSIEEYEKQGYTVISSDMDSASIQALLTDGAKLVLSGDIVLDDKLSIDAANVTIDGNGYKISYAGSDNMLTVRGFDTTITNINFNYSAADGGSAILIDGADASADISHLTLKADGKRAYGVRVTNGGGLKLDNAQGISVSGFGSQKLVNGNAELYDGQSNTQAIVGEIGTDSLAASAANQFYAPGTDKHGTFGQGSWYLPSIGELMDMYGTDASGMTGGYGTSGAVGDNKNKINTALTTLAGKDSKIASALSNGHYWSSSEFNNASTSWLLDTDNGCCQLR